MAVFWVPSCSPSSPSSRSHGSFALGAVEVSCCCRNETTPGRSSGHEITHKRYIWVEETRAFLFVTRIGENYLPKATTHLRVAQRNWVGCRPRVLKLSSNFGENKANLNHTYLSIHLYTLLDMLQVLINEERCKHTKECKSIAVKGLCKNAS